MTPETGRWALAVHGGAKEIAPEEARANRDGCRRALAAGRAILETGGSALDAVEAAVRVLEDDPAFNAGYGSALNAAGEVEMCAAVMSGTDLAIGSVGVVRGVRHPVSVARLLMPDTAILLAGEGARRFAEAKGAELCAPEDLIVEAQRSAPAAAHDTVGAVALDSSGNIAAATSTGGLPGAPVGRMGDSAIPGCGYYADNHIGAIALSGHGEPIARLTLSARMMNDLLRDGPKQALEKGLARVVQLGGDAGGIALTKTGEVGWWHNSPHFAVATATSDDPEGGIWLNKDEK